MRAASSAFVLCVLLGLASCARTLAIERPLPDDVRAAWLCRPDHPRDACASADLTTTVLHADGTRSVVTRGASASPSADCFYVYPTVDLELVPGNHRDLADTSRMLAATLAQVGGLRETCALWVPLYHQVTLGTYLQPREILESGLAKGYADVERAFREYLTGPGADPKRKIVLIGHSQGGEMIIRLIRARGGFSGRDSAAGWCCAVARWAILSSSASVLNGPRPTTAGGARAARRSARRLPGWPTFSALIASVRSPTRPPPAPDAVDARRPRDRHRRPRRPALPARGGD